MSDTHERLGKDSRLKRYASLSEMIGDAEYKIGRPRQLFTGATSRDVLPIAQR